MEAELKMLHKDSKVNIHLNALKAKLKKYQTGKTPAPDGIHGFWFKKFTSIHDRHATEMNKCIQKTKIPEWMTIGKTTLI